MLSGREKQDQTIVYKWMTVKYISTNCSPLSWITILSVFPCVMYNILYLFVWAEWQVLPFGLVTGQPGATSERSSQGPVQSDLQTRSGGRRGGRSVVAAGVYPEGTAAVWCWASFQQRPALQVTLSIVYKWYPYCRLNSFSLLGKWWR